MPSHHSVEQERVLTYVNRLRDKLGKRPLRKLPKGKPEDANSCPIANALCRASAFDGTYAEVDSLLVRVVVEHDTKLNVKPPRYVQHFIERFDEGEIPELVRR